MSYWTYGKFKIVFLGKIGLHDIQDTIGLALSCNSMCEMDKSIEENDALLIPYGSEGTMDIKSIVHKGNDTIVTISGNLRDVYGYEDFDKWFEAITTKNTRFRKNVEYGNIRFIKSIDGYADKDYPSNPKHYKYRYKYTSEEKKRLLRWYVYKFSFGLIQI